MQRAGPLAALALLAALLAVQPAVDGLSPQLQRLGDDLASGEYTPWRGADPSSGEAGTEVPESLASRVPGSLTGQGGARFTAGADSFPDSWNMDRLGAAGDVTIQMRCDPALGALKRVKAYDHIGDPSRFRTGDGGGQAPDYELTVRNPDVGPPEGDPSLDYDRSFTCTFPVRLQGDDPVPIVSPHPKAIVEDVTADPAAPGLAIHKDSADTFLATAEVSKKVTLTVTYRADSTYYDAAIPRDAHLGDIPEDRRVDLPPVYRDRAEPVLQEMGLENTTRLKPLLRGMQDHFLAFGDGPIPGTDVYPDKYHALALGENGCCRHRAFAFAVTAQALGIPTRVVANEAHAYAESWVPDRGWMQFNLGGCGSYETRNPEDRVAFRPGSTDPQADEPPEDDEPRDRLPTNTTITRAPDAVDKGEGFTVAGTVTDPDGDGLADVPVAVFLNATKDQAGHLAATARTDATGTFNASASVPGDAPPRDYNLVAGARPATTEGVATAASWSDPQVRVTADTRIVPDVPEAVGVETPFSASARLEDEGGAVVPDADVTLLVDGTREATRTTDGDGEVAFRLAFETLGNRSLTFRFDGAGAAAPSEATTTLRVSEVGLVAPRNATVLRGDETALEGVTTVGGTPAPADVTASPELVIVPLDDPAPTDSGGQDGLEVPTGRQVPLVADEAGAWALPVRAPEDAPLGPTRVSYAHEDAHLGTTRLRVKAPTSLAVDPTEPLDPTEPVAGLELTSEGTPVAGADLRVTLEQGDRRTATTVTTNASGGATVAFPAGWGGDEDVAVEARYPGDATTGAVAAQGTAAAPADPFLDPPTALAAGALVLGLAAAGAGLRHAGTRSRVAAAWHRLHGRRRPRLHLGLREVDPGLPPVWEAGGAVTLHVEARLDDEAVADHPVHVTVDGTRYQLDLDDAGQASLTVERDDPGEVPVAVRLPRDDEAGLLGAEATLAIRFVDYGREMTRVYEALRAWAGDRGVDVADPATPREVAARLHGAGAPREAVAGLVRRFEAVNYAGDEATRADYVGLVRARDRIQEALREGSSG